MEIYAKLFDLSGKVTIVTGSGRGLGRYMAEELAAFGVQVIVCDIAVEEAELTVEYSLTDYGRSVLPLVEDTVELTPYIRRQSRECAISQAATDSH